MNIYRLCGNSLHLSLSIALFIKTLSVSSKNVKFLSFSRKLNITPEIELGSIHDQNSVFGFFYKHVMLWYNVLWMQFESEDNTFGLLQCVFVVFYWMNIREQLSTTNQITIKEYKIIPSLKQFKQNEYNDSKWLY